MLLEWGGGGVKTDNILFIILGLINYDKSILSRSFVLELSRIFYDGSGWVFEHRNTKSNYIIWGAFIAVTIRNSNTISVNTAVD